MTITFVGAHAALSNVDTVPAHQPEDTIFQCGFRSSAATIPTDPAGAFITYDTEAANTCAQRCVYRQAVSTTGEGATLTGATAVSTIVIRGPWGSGGGNATTGSSATMNWAAFNIDDTSGNNFLVGFANSRSATNVQTTAPTGLTAVTTQVNSSAGYTGSQNTNWPSTNQVVNTNTGYITALLELTSYTTFSAIRVSSNVTLSNLNLSSQSSSAVGDRTVVTTYARQSGKYVFRFIFGSGSQTANGNGVGLCNTSQSPNSGLASNTTSLGYFLDGSVFVNNTQQSGTTQATYADGDTVYVAVDIDNKLMWSKKGSGGTWTGNPDAGTGGISISALSFTGGILPCRAAGSVESTVTTYDGSATGHGLTTFTPWDGAPAGSGVSVSGQSVTNSQGVVTFSNAKSLTGQAATSAQGTLTGGPAPSLTGQANTSAQGSLSLSASKAITGQAAALAQGAVTFSNAKSLTGQSATGNQGVVGPTVSTTITGQASTAAQGSITLGFGASVTLTGQAMTTGQGSLSIGTGTNISLTGQAGTSAQGTIASSVRPSLIGQSTPANQGVVSPRVSVLPTGLAVTTSQGVLTVQYGITTSISGQAMTSAQGMIFTGSGNNVVYEIARAFYYGGFDSGGFYTYDNRALTAGQGTVTINTNVAPLDGEECVAGQGSIGITISKPLPGQVMTSATGTLVNQVAFAIPGNTMTAQQGGNVYVFFPSFFIGSGEEIYIEPEDNYLLTPAEERNIYVLEGDRDSSSSGEDRTLPVPEHRGVYGDSG